MKKLFVLFGLIFTLFGITTNAHAVDYYFTVTTTNQTSSSWDFQFKISAKGTFYVDCGTNGTLSRVSGGSATVSGATIKKTSNVSVTTFKCQYTSSGSKTIQFGGVATAYNTGKTTAAITFYVQNSASVYSSTLISSISGNLSTIFPNNGTAFGSHPVFYQTFQGATSLTSIPNTLFSGYTNGGSYMFPYTFSNCTGITSIPETLFNFGGNNVSGQDSMFYNTFNNCTGITSIPASLFQRVTSGAQSLFSSTFSGCTGLTSIPETLFNFGGNNVSGQNYMFSNTFGGCTGLTSIPANLFQRVTSGAPYMFRWTFCYCPIITSIPSNLFNFGGNNVSGQEAMFLGTFEGCTGLASIPENLFRRVTSAAQEMFEQTFSGCTNITGYIPPSTFAGLIANGHPTATVMWSNTFYQTQLVTTCPAGEPQYITGYEEEWRKVSCGVVIINMTWDGSSGTPASCTYGGTFVPPTPAARPGYRFTGWKVKTVNP